MRHYFFGLLLIALLSCKKDKTAAPKCRIASVNSAGLLMPVSYQGDTLMVWGGSHLFFSTPGKLERIEQPLPDPYIRTELRYNNKGKVIESMTYFKELGTWVYKAKMVFSYSNNRLTNIRTESTFSTSGTIYDYDLTWEGDDIRSVTSRIGTNILCTQQFSYQLTETNPMTGYSYLYFGDGDADYAGYKLPFYFSKHLLAKGENNCPLSEPRTYAYTFTSNGLLATVSYNGNLHSAYTYQCP